MNTRILGLFFSLILFVNARAATFSFAPNVVSNDYAGLITFQMSGLSSGETVQVQQFYDANGNGIVEPTDTCVRNEMVTDGQAKLFNGATNINLFRDEDMATNGAIVATFRFSLSPDFARGIASYVFRFSSPSNHFTTTDLPFTVRGVPYNQGIQGTVVCGATNVPSAYVALVQNSAGAVQTVIAGTTADAGGNYSIKAPPGIYQVLAFQHGYVNFLTNFPGFLLLPNQTVTTNLNLLAADSMISGTLVDSTNNLLKAVPNAQLIAYSTNLMITIADADSNANFSIPVTANNVWTVRATPQSAGSQSYLVPDASIENHAQTFTGPATNVVVMLKHATALIYGRVVDNNGNPIPAISLFANADFGQYNTSGTSDGNGFYSMAIDAGQGIISVNNSANPPANGYIFPTPQFAINNGQALSLTVTGRVSTARFRSHVVIDTGVPLAGLETVGDSYEFYGSYTFATADLNGFLDMPVFGGEWGFLFGGIAPSGQPPTGLIFPDVPPFFITDGVNLTNDIVVHTATGTISGYVHGANNQGIANLMVTVTNHVGTTNFTLHATTDTNGNYSVVIFNGTWNVSPDNDTLASRGYNTVDPIDVLVPPTNGIANFVAIPVPPPQILTTSLYNGVISNFYSTGFDVTNGSYPNLWSLVSGSLPPGLTLNVFGFISGTPTNLGLSQFTVKVQDSRGSNDVKTLTIKIVPVPTGPPQILTTYLADSAEGCSYTTHLQATNGTQPYAWTLAADSDPLPSGLQLASDGTLSGTPTTNGYFSVDVEVTGGDDSVVDGMVSIQVNPPLQLYPGPLSGGSVGANYFGALYVYGGAQPQTWSLISGTLPPGITLDPATGYLTGIPVNTGTYPLTLRVTDGCSTIDTPAIITNYPALRITTVTLPPASVYADYSAQLQASGGVPPYQWYYSSLYDGLTVATDGSITGRAYSATDDLVTFEVYDAIGDYATADLDIISTAQPILDLPAIAGANEFTFRATAASGQDYILQSSPELTNWTDLFTTNPPANIFYLTDTNASGSIRFYRLKVGP